MSESPRPTRAEWLMLAAIVLLGWGLRLAYPDRMAVEHFDEGVYASNYWFGPRDDHQYPNQHLYAPPLVPVLIETIFQVFGPSNLGAMSVSLAAGCLTIPLLWWVGRRWFGPVAGLTAAGLCASSDLHIAFSRTCLVDVLLGFWLLLALWLMTEALDRKSWFLAVAGGSATALGWWTKYNGWLPLAIVLVGLLLWWCERRCRAATRLEPSAVGRRLFLWVLGAGTTGCLAIPLWFVLQRQGGYAAVVANQQGYLVGWSGWGLSLIEHLTDLERLGGLPLLVSFLTILALFVPARCTWNALIIWSITMSLLAGTLMPSVSTLPLSMILILFLIERIQRGPSFRTIAASIVDAWILSLAVLTPLYTPYPRIWLPLHLGIWLAVGRFASTVTFPRTCGPEKTGALCSGGKQNRNRPSAAFVVIVSGLIVPIVLVLLWATWLRGTDNVPGWMDRRGVAGVAAEISRQIEKQTGPNEDFSVDVYGEPALLFQLRLAGIDAVRPVEHLNFAHRNAPQPAAPNFVIIGPRAERTAGFEQQWQDAQGRLEPVAQIPWSQSLVVTSDEVNRAGPVPEAVVRLYRLK